EKIIGLLLSGQVISAGPRQTGLLTDAVVSVDAMQCQLVLIMTVNARNSSFVIWRKKHVQNLLASKCIWRWSTFLQKWILPTKSACQILIMLCNEISGLFVKNANKTSFFAFLDL